MSDDAGTRSDKLGMRSWDGVPVSRSDSPVNRGLFEQGEGEVGLLGGELTEIDWERLFRRIDDGRGGTGNFFFDGDSASETSPETGADSIWRAGVAVTDFAGDSLRIAGRRHCALDLWASTIVAARSRGSGLRVSDQTGT